MSNCIGHTTLSIQVQRLQSNGFLDVQGLVKPNHKPQYQLLHNYTDSTVDCRDLYHVIYTTHLQ